MPYNPENPLIVQSDMTILLETMGALYEPARDFLAQFAELTKSPEYLHTYTLTPLSLWNAASAGMTAVEVNDGLNRWAKYDIPRNVSAEIRELMARYGRVKLHQTPDGLVITSEDPNALAEICASNQTSPFIERQLDTKSILLKPGTRGRAKQALIKIGYPVEDLAGYREGDQLDVGFRKVTLAGRDFSLRHYQKEAVDLFYLNGSARGGSGTLVLPCGAGKTIIGISCMVSVGQRCLILTTNVTSVRQWVTEILDKTDLTTEQVGEYSAENKTVRPVTVTTYQMMTYRKRGEDEYPHLDVFMKHAWGLVIYDEVHLLPAPVFRTTAEIQAMRRVGLTATLVREDGREDDVFSLIGPKRFDKPWKELEREGFIAEATCTEIRIPLPEDRKLEYAVAELKAKYRLSMENPYKIQVVQQLLERHKDDHVLVIGQYLDQLENVRRVTGAPIITGQTPNDERDRLYADFKKGRIRTLIVSKVANFAVDLPDANVAIQISGTFRSRQEEAQRVGRVLRPKPGDNQSTFYSVVTKDTKDQECAKKRSMFLTEQGYRYKIAVVEEKQNKLDVLGALDGIHEATFVADDTSEDPNAEDELLAADDE
jgi:DNA excision repair protein ERCC-3